MARKHFFRPDQISCGRCGYRGTSVRNKAHLSILFFLVILNLYFIYDLIRHPVFGLIGDLFSLSVMLGVVRLVVRDERALLCPRCGNVNYDIIREK